MANLPKTTPKKRSGEQPLQEIAWNDPAGLPAYSNITMQKEDDITISSKEQKKLCSRLCMRQKRLEKKEQKWILLAKSCQVQGTVLHPCVLLSGKEDTQDDWLWSEDHLQ
jgi:hypothetical protein